MSESWKTLVQQESPAAQARRESYEKSSEKQDRYLTKKCFYSGWYIGQGNPWDYEKCRLYKALGFKQLKKGSEILTKSKGTGEYYLEKTSATTYDIKEKKTGSTSIQTYIMGADKNNITDMEQYVELVEEAEAFFAEARKAFEGTISPSCFNLIMRLYIHHLAIFLFAAVLIFPIPFYAAFLIWDALTYNKRHANYLPWVKAYQDKLNDFEMRAKKIINFT